MIPQTNWLDRKFNFNFPVGFFPMIVERLLGTPSRVEEMTRGILPAILTRRERESWSIQEHAGHLIDLEELHNGRIDDFLERATVLRAWDAGNKRTYEANHNAQSILEIQKAFRYGRFTFVERLIDADEHLLSRSALHPRLNVAMRLIDMAYFVAEHDDHHLARMRSLMH